MAAGAPDGLTHVASSADGSRIFAAGYRTNIYHAQSFTTLGSTGSVAGSPYQMVELQYFGSGLFSVVSNQGGTLRVQ